MDQEIAVRPVEGVVLPSATEIVSKYLAFREYIKTETAKHEERMRPYAQAMLALEGAAALLAQQTEQRSLSTNVGTAFPVTKTSVTCQDREAWLDFVADTGSWDGLTRHIASEFVEAWMENHEGQPPPGVKVEKFTKWQFRKA